MLLRQSGTIMGYLGRAFCLVISLLVAVILAVSDSREKNTGTKFLIIQVYRHTKGVSCNLEAHVTTEHADGAVVELRTPRLREEEGGFRHSIQIQRHESGVLCASRAADELSQLPSTGKNDHVKILEANNEISVLMVTRSLNRWAEMHFLYPMDIAETVYYFLGLRFAALALVATQTNTRVDVSDCIHTHSNLHHYLGQKEEACSFHMIIDLERYESLFVQEHDDDIKIPPGALIMANKPVIAVVEATQAYVHIDGNDVIAYGYSATQLQPKARWGSVFLVPQPRNPDVKTISIAVVFERVVPPEERTYTIKIAPFKPVKYYVRNRNSKIHDVGTNFASFLTVKTEVPVSIMLLLFTVHANLTALAAANVPATSAYLHRYTWSMKELKQVNCLHVFGFAGELASLRLRQPNGHHVKITIIETTAEHESGRILLDKTGTYTLTYVGDERLPRSGFAALLEMYDTADHKTIVTELGMRWTKAEEDCVFGVPFPLRCKNTTREPLPPAIETEVDQLDAQGFEKSWECAGGPEWRVTNRHCKKPEPKYEPNPCKFLDPSANKSACNESSPFCPGSMWGGSCEHACSLQCADKKCDRMSGECHDGCTSGYYGPRCDIECHRGYGGKNCRTRCATLCSSGLCDPVSLRCQAQQNYSKIWLGMAVTCAAIFIVAPAMGSACYCLLLVRQPRDGSSQDQKKKLYFEGEYDDDYDLEYYDEDEDYDEDESTSSSSSRSSYGSVKLWGEPEQDLKLSVFDAADSADDGSTAKSGNISLPTKSTRGSEV